MTQRKRLKICFLVDKSGPFYLGGYEKRVWMLSSSLSSKADVRVYTTCEQSSSRDRVRFEKICTPAFQPYSLYKRSMIHDAIYSISLHKNPFTDWVPDVLYVEAAPFGHLPFLLRWALPNNVLKLLNVNEAWVTYPYKRGITGNAFNKTLRHLLRLGTKWADVVICVATPTATALRESFRKEAVEVVPSGVNLSQTQVYTVKSGSSKKYDFVTMGRCVPIKRQIDFVRAVGSLRRKSGWNAKCLVIGDGPELPSLKQEAKALGVDQNFAFPGYVDEDMLLEMLSTARVFVLPSEREGFSLATLEAQALGLPAIVARPLQPEVFGVSDIVKHGINGLYFDQGNLEELCQRMVQIHDSPSLRQRLGAASLVMAQKFDWNTISDDFISMCRAHLVEMPVERYREPNGIVSSDGSS